MGFAALSPSHGAADPVNNDMSPYGGLAKRNPPIRPRHRCRSGGLRLRLIRRTCFTLRLTGISRLRECVYGPEPRRYVAAQEVVMKASRAAATAIIGSMLLLVPAQAAEV